MIKRTTTQRKKVLNYLKYIMLAFGLLGLELLLLSFEQQLYGNIGPQDFTIIQAIIHWIIIITIWLLGSVYILREVTKDDITLFESKKFVRKNILYIFVVCVLAIIFSSYLWGWQLKPIVEFQRMLLRYENLAIISFIFQIIYYIAEVLVMLLILALGQAMGEDITQNVLVPWGSIALALTWGIGHILSKDLVTAVYCVIFSLFCGALFLLVQKNFKYSIILIALIFII